jgi:hypothetical protein
MVGVEENVDPGTIAEGLSIIGFLLKIGQRSKNDFVLVMLK